MIRGYLKHRKKLADGPPARFEQLPKVTIQLPLYNEKFVVERLVEETLKMRYPRELFQIQVLDDSTDETHPFAEALCARYQAMGHPVEYRHRSNRHGYKAGALQEGLQSATGEFIAVFDADFIPPEDFLERTMHYFTDPKVGVVQTRWTYLNRHYNLLTEVEAMLLDGHFVLEHGARFGGGLFFNFNGTAGILRREMIEDAGGWQHDTLTEDSDLSYRAQMKGWKFVYIPGVECPSELPVEMNGFQVQQSRWSKGLTQVAIKLLPAILKADLPRRVKMEAIFHLTPNISYPMMIRGQRADAAGDDRPLLHGWAADGIYRHAADHRVLLVDHGVLYARASGTVSEDVEARHFLHSGPDGGRGCAYDQQHARGIGSSLRRADGVRAYSEVCDRRRSKSEAPGGGEVSQPGRMAALCSNLHSAPTSWS